MAFTPYPNEIYTIFSFLGFIMCIIPLPWHLKAWNGGTCLYMFWTGMGCFIFFINSIIWHENAFNPAPIWCDICVRILIGCSIGVPASSFCINRRLYLLQFDATGRKTITKSDKLRILAMDLSISAGLPILIMILQYIPQGHRFNILENIGCYPATYNTWVGVLITNVPQVLIGLISATYGILAMISINKRRTEFNDLVARHLNVTSSLYFRLLFLAGIEALLTVPITGLYFIKNMTSLRPWISWEDTHSNFNRADQVPAIIWHSSPSAAYIEFSHWVFIICAILFFSFFGFAEEARLQYRLAFRYFLKASGIRVGCQTEKITFQSGGPMSQSGPADRITFAVKKRHRTDSFSTISTLSLSSESGNSEKEGESWSDNTLYDTKGSVHGHFGTQNSSSPSASSVTVVVAPEAVIWKTPPLQSDSLTPSKNTQVLPPVNQENERRPSVGSRTARYLYSFINFGDDPSIKHDSFPPSPQIDISTVEEGQPPEAKTKRRRISQHFRSFLNLR